MGTPLSSRTRIIAFILANLISLGLLVWTLRDANLSDLKDDIAALNWWWVALAVLAELGVYLWQAERWRLVLRPVASLGFWQGVRAIFAGLFVSEVLPIRGGEVLRCYLVSRWTGLPFSVSVSSILIERVFDGIWLWLGLLIALRFVPLPEKLAYVNDGLGVFVLAGAIVLALALFRPRATRNNVAQQGWRRRLFVLMDDLALIGHSRYLFFALAISIPYLLMQAIPIWALLQGYGFDLGLGAALAIMLILRLASILPQASLNLGLFPFLTKVLLERTFNVVPDQAARFSLLLWGVIKLPELAAGFAAIAITEAKIGELRKAAHDQAALQRN